MPATLPSNPQSKESALQSGSCLCLQFCSSLLCELLFSSRSCSFSPFPIDLFGPFGRVGQHDDMIGRNLEEASCHSKVLFLPASPKHQLSCIKR